MRSLIIIEVEHGEDTDTLSDTLWQLGLEGNIGGRPDAITDYTVRVDLPDCFVLDSTHTD